MIHKYTTIVDKSSIQISTVAVYLLVLRGPVVIQAMTWITDFGVQIMAWITDDSTIGQIVCYSDPHCTLNALYTTPRCTMVDYQLHSYYWVA